MTDTLTTLTQAAGEALKAATVHTTKATDEGLRLYLKAAGHAHEAKLAGMTDRALAAAAGISRLATAQAIMLAGEVMAKSHTLHSLKAEWDAIPAEWTAVLKACNRALRSTNDGGCGIDAARSAASDTGTAGKAAEAILAACDKAKRDKDKADAQAKRDKHATEVGESGLVLEALESLIKRTGALKGRTGLAANQAKVLLLVDAAKALVIEE